MAGGGRLAKTNTKTGYKDEINWIPAFAGMTKGELG